MTDYFIENKAQTGHAWRSARSGARCMVLRAFAAMFQMCLVLFLARRLTPEDYGLVAMVLALTGFAPLIVDLGTREAIVQRFRITESEVASLFWLTVAVGLFFTCLVAVSSPLIAWFYGEPRLLTITLVGSLTFITAALPCQHYALLKRAMRFQTVVTIEVVAMVLSGLVAIAMAFQGWHYWALIARPIVMNLLIVAGVWLFCRWVPARPTMTTGVREMIKFGMNMIGYNFIDFAGKNSDRVAVGRQYG